MRFILVSLFLFLAKQQQAQEMTQKLVQKEAQSRDGSPIRI